MAGTYASRTDVASDRSRAEIERTLKRYGASQFMYGYDNGRAVVAFVARGRQIRFVIAMPDPADPIFTRTPTGKVRAPSSAAAEHDQAVRQRWRALVLVVKAKLEAVTSGLMTFEREFLAYTVLPDGRTVAEHTEAAVEAAYATGQTPALLPAYSDTDRPALPPGSDQ